jgi:CRP-like cAMP-binding protein
MNSFKDLFAVVSAVHPLRQELMKALAPLLKVQKVKAGTIILREGEMANYVYFIRKGLLRAFHFEEGNDITSWIMKELDLMLSVYGFFTRQPSQDSIEALEDCELVYFDHDTLDYFYEKFVEFNINGRKLTEKYYVLSEQRTILLRNHNATERYQYMLDHYPEIVKRVQLQHLASYLGMSKETLSRIRKKKNDGN